MVCTHCAFLPSLLHIRNDMNMKSNNFVFSSKRPNFVLLCSINVNGDSYTTVVYEAVRLLGPPARFEPSKLKVVLTREDVNNKYAGVFPRTYILSHCDFTANLTFTISHVINLEQLGGWYSRDDVVAEWKKVNGEMCFHVHCFVSGPNLLLELTAELRYQIFCKELPLFYYGVPANSEVEEEDLLACSSLSPVRCWRHDLIEVAIENFEDCMRTSLQSYFMENAKAKITIT